jgi:hypothetical protein
MSDLDYSMLRTDMRLDSITVVPEPGAISLLLIGGLLCVVWHRRKVIGRQGGIMHDGPGS